MTSVIEIRVPDIGSTQAVPVIEIPSKVGDHLSAEDVLIVLESDKATMEVPAETEGKLLELLVSEGDEVTEGTLIARLEGLADSAVQTAPVESQQSTESAQVLSAAPPKSTSVAEPEIVTTSTVAKTGLPSTPVYASPSIRRYARTLGVPLEQVKGTGSKGRILREDVEAYVKQALTASTVPSGMGSSLIAGLPDWPKLDFEKLGPVERVKLSRIGRISGPVLARNSLVIPHVCNFDKADITNLESFRKTLNSEASAEDAKVTMLAFTVKAVVAALKAYPKFNSSLDGEEVVLKKYWHIGVAADTPEGLVVPVIRDADRKCIREIANEMQMLASKARNGKLSPSEMSGATFTISSLGGIGGTGFTPIINAPEVAILGMTRAEVAPHWTGSEFEPRLIQPLSLSWDHRVVDGVAAARFLKHVSASLNDFRRVLV